jgi:hypothetical protein
MYFISVRFKTKVSTIKRKLCSVHLWLFLSQKDNEGGDTENRGGLGVKNKSLVTSSPTFRSSS